MKPNAISKPFSAAQMAAALAHAPDVAVPDNDAPATNATDWQGAIVSHSYADLKTQLANKRMGRPPSTSPKVQVAIRFDQDVLASFKASGRGWQTRINEVLRDWLKDHSPV
jgi:uncharacterized protein (DUF4415 family)